MGQPLLFFLFPECQHLCALCLLLFLLFLVIGSIVSKCPPAVRGKLAHNFAYLELDEDSNFDGWTNDAQFIPSTIMKLSIHLGDGWAKEWNQQVPVFSLSSSPALKCWWRGLKTCHCEHDTIQVHVGEAIPSLPSMSLVTFSSFCACGFDTVFKT